ncbi:competence protein [Acinetobacter sp. TGL-Y2]|nr:competence protein [Acinetobacter sp. TGL-Y2]
MGLSTFYMGQYFAQNALDQRLAQRIMARADVSAVVYIDRLDESNSSDANSLTKQRATIIKAGAVPYDVILYLKPEMQSEFLKLGHYYQLTGVIKPAHSYAVKSVFDQEKWLLQHNIMGTVQVQSLQVVSAFEVQELGLQSFIQQQSGWTARLKLYAEKKRLGFRQYIERQPLKHKGLLLALLTGDESLLSDTIKEQFKILGISHLLAISGPHVLIFALLFCFVLNILVTKLIPHVFLKIPRPYFLVMPFLLCVMSYTAFVGFEIPAMRTCLTVLIISAVILLKQKVHALKLLLLSASLLLWLDPFSILSAAFWLSYGACFILIRVYQTIQTQNPTQTQKTAQISDPDSDQSGIVTWKSKTIVFLKVLFDSQWKIFIALFPLVALIFQQVSWISPLVNLIAIPLIGVVIVPLEVLGACLSVFTDPLGLIFFHSADAVLSFLLGCLGFLQTVFNPQLSWLALSPMMIALIAIAIVIVFLPRGVFPKSWAVICIVAVILGLQKQPEFRFTVLDVGQGQAIFMQLPSQNIMIDVGGYYDETKFSVGRQIILPYLFGQGISRLDRIYLTHLDQDHAGAFEAVQQDIAIQQVYSNEQDQKFNSTPFEYCYAGQTWQEDGIKIEVLSPQKDDLNFVEGQQNERSCVLYIQVPKAKDYQNFLIMGDAGWETEFQLLQRYPDLKVDVLILGHHGSQHSSSFGFLKRLQPKLAIASAGYENRYHHPHPIVIERLKALSIPLETTIDQGSILFEMGQDREMRHRVFRETRQWLRR